MKKNKIYTVSFFAILLATTLPNILVAQTCPPSVVASSNTTPITVNSNIATVDPSSNPPTSIFQYNSTCTAARSNADLTIDVTFEGTTTTFTRQDDFIGFNPATSTCRFRYDNVAANHSITPPFSIDFPDLGISCSYAASGLFPVEISRFEVESIENEVLITWETSAEINNDYFEIYQSSDGKTWKSIAIISGAGTTFQTVRYQFIDENPSIADNYYMLSQVDFDGSMEAFEIQPPPIEAEGNKVDLYPNPAHESLIIEVSENANFPIEISVFDVTGKQINTFLMEDAKQRIDVSLYEKGFYFLQINDGRRVTTEQFLKQ